jgi:Mg/Co/Ni transporter MgtE
MDERKSLLATSIQGGMPTTTSACGTRAVLFFFPPRGGNFVDTLLAKPWYSRSLRFLPALLLTLGLETVNSAVLGENQSWLQNHWILVMAMPVISALAGNIGLQTSSSISSMENVRREQQKPVHVLMVAKSYFIHNFLNIGILAVVMGLMTFLFDNKNCRVVHSVIIVVGSIVNMLIASFFGVVTPLAAARFNFDPSAIAGPFETAMQDMLGFMVLMYMAKSMIVSFGGASCPLDLGNITITLPFDSFNFGCLRDVCLGSLRCYKSTC